MSSTLEGETSASPGGAVDHRQSERRLTGDRRKTAVAVEVERRATDRRSFVERRAELRRRLNDRRHLLG
jgi:hypothetical protein